MTTSWRSTYRPVKVDVRDLSAALDEYLANAAHSARTIESYEHAWQVWESFCSSRGICPMPATGESLAALVGAGALGTLRTSAARRHGPVSQGQVDVIVSAVRDRHRRAGIPFALDDLDENSAHSARRAAYARNIRTTLEATGALNFDQFKKLLNSDVSGSPTRQAALAAIGVSVSLDLPLEMVASLTEDDVQRGDSFIVIRGTRLDCAHAAPNRGVPLGCPTCLVGRLKGAGQREIFDAALPPHRRYRGQGPLTRELESFVAGKLASGPALDGTGRRGPAKSP